MPQLPNPLKPDPLKVNPTAPIRPVGAPTGAAARLGLGQAPNLAGPVSHMAPTKRPQQPDSQLQLNNTPGWHMGVNLANQTSSDPLQRMQLLSKNTLAQPKTAECELTRMTDILSRLAVKPVPAIIKAALRL